jgi:hypothetical protein
MRSLHSIHRGVLVALLAAAATMAASAQERPAELQSWQVPGWSFTPGVSFGTVYDSNVAIAGPDVNGNTAGDTMFQIEPFGQLEFYSPRTTFTSGYRGGFKRYIDLGDLDSTDHRASFTLRHRLSRRVTLFAEDSFSQLPTTDVLMLNGLPFARVGSTFNAAGGGVEARVSKSLDLTARYEMSWGTFDRVEQGPQLTGGVVHGLRSSLRHHFTERASAGGEYGIRWADLNDGARQFTYQDVGGVLQYKTGEDTVVEGAGGLSYLIDRRFDATRTSPYVRAAVKHRAQRASLGADYRRSYAPSFFLGGSHLAQELSGYVDMPLNRNRTYVQGMAAWRRAEPVLLGETALKTLWLREAVGYKLQRWLRVEVYHLYMNQNNRLAGGKITRQMLGAQLIVSEPVRIR